MRNEEVLIYSPVIRSLSNHQVQSDELHYAQPSKRRPTVNTGNKNKHFQLSTNSAGHLTLGNYSNLSTLNLQRQSEQSKSLIKEHKPQVVQVYPKRADSSKSVNSTSCDNHSKNKLDTEYKTTAVKNETRRFSIASDQDLEYEQMVQHSLLGVSKRASTDKRKNSSKGKNDPHSFLNTLSHMERNQENRFQTSRWDRIRDERNRSPANFELASNGFHSFCSPNNNHSFASKDQLEEMPELVSGEFLLRSRRPSGLNASHSQIFDGAVETPEQRLHSLPPSLYGQHVNQLVAESKEGRHNNGFNPSMASNQHSYLNERKHKTGKTLAAQLQSYFFAGSLSSKRKLKLKTKEPLQDHCDSSRAESELKYHGDMSKLEQTSVQLLNRLHLSEDEDEDQNSQDLNSEKFPLPNVYKKNFIIKGHSNCGLYSKRRPVAEGIGVKTLEKPPRGKSKSKMSSNAANGRISKNQIELVPNSCVNMGGNGGAGKEGRVEGAATGIGMRVNSVEHQGFKSLQRFQSPDESMNKGHNAKLVHREIALAAKELGAWY